MFYIPKVGILEIISVLVQNWLNSFCTEKLWPDANNNSSFFSIPLLSLFVW
jgi:hypothetical protein